MSPLTPPVTPVTTPVPDTTVALPFPAVHTPPPGVDPKALVRPTQAFSVPVMAVGCAFTVTVAVVIHPVGSVYVMVPVPVSDVDAVTVAVLPAPAIVMSGLLAVLQVPPVVEELTEVLAPSQIFILPVILFGFGFTVTI